MQTKSWAPSLTDWRTSVTSDKFSAPHAHGSDRTKARYGKSCGSSFNRSSSLPNTPKPQAAENRQAQLCRGRDVARKPGRSTRYRSEPRVTRKDVRENTSAPYSLVNVFDENQFPDLLSAKDMATPQKKTGLCLKRQATPTRCSRTQPRKDNELHSTGLVAHMHQHAAKSQGHEQKPTERTVKEGWREFSNKPADLTAAMRSGTATVQKNSAEPLQRRAKTIAEKNLLVDGSPGGSVDVAAGCASADTGVGDQTVQNVVDASSPPFTIESLHVTPAAESSSERSKSETMQGDHPETSGNLADEILSHSSSEFLTEELSGTLQLHELLAAGTPVEPPAEDVTSHEVVPPVEESSICQVDPPAAIVAPCAAACLAEDTTPCKVDVSAENATPCKERARVARPHRPSSATPLTRLQRGTSRADDYIDRVTSSKEMKRINNCKTAAAILLEETDPRDPQALAFAFLSKAVLVHPLRWHAEDNAACQWHSEDNVMELAFARLTAAYRHYVEGTQYRHGAELPSARHADFATFKCAVQTAMEAGGLDLQVCNSCQTLLSRQQALEAGDTKDTANQARVGCSPFS